MFMFCQSGFSLAFLLDFDEKTIQRKIARGKNGEKEKNEESYSEIILISSFIVGFL